MGIVVDSEELECGWLSDKQLQVPVFSSLDDTCGVSDVEGLSRP